MWDLCLNHNILSHPNLWHPHHRWGTPAYLIRSGTWRDIAVESGLALISLVTGPLSFSQKTNMMGCAVTVYNIGILPSLTRCRTFVLTVTFSLTQFYDTLVTDGLPCVPHPLRRLARHWSLVWLGTDIAYQGAITFHPKDLSYGVCSAIIYNSRILPFVIWWGTFVLTTTFLS